MMADFQTKITEIKERCVYTPMAPQLTEMSPTFSLISSLLYNSSKNGGKWRENAISRYFAKTSGGMYGGVRPLQFQKSWYLPVSYNPPQVFSWYSHCYLKIFKITPPPYLWLHCSLFKCNSSFHQSSLYNGTSNIQCRRPYEIFQKLGFS